MKFRDFCPIMALALSILGTNRHWTAFYPEARPCLPDLLVDDTPEKIQELYQYFQKNWKVTSDDMRKGFAPVELSNISNISCESDKTARLLLGEGEPRSRYAGS